MYSLKNSSRVLYLIYPTISHYKTILPAALADQKNGATVYIGGSKPFELFILENGLHFLEIDYLETYKIQSGSTAILLYIKCFYPSFTKQLFKEFLVFKNSLHQKVNSANFDIIYLDAHISYYYVLLPMKEKIQIVNTKLSTLKTKGIPPLSSGIQIHQGMLYSVITEILWIKIYFRNYFASLLRKIVFHERNEIYFINKILSREGSCFSDYFLPTYKSSFYFELDLDKVKVPTLIMGAGNIEYHWKTLHPLEQYWNIPLAVVFEDMNKWNALNKFLTRFHERSSKTNCKLIYCSFGSITNRFKLKIQRFIKIACKAFANHHEFMLIISTGGIDINSTGKAENIFINKMLPQLHILSVCNMMITHGGMNSIKECLYFKVPMLIYPLNLQFDQPGNAARLHHYKYGIKGNMDAVTPVDILKKTYKVIKLSDGVSSDL